MLRTKEHKDESTKRLREELKKNPANYPHFADKKFFSVNIINLGQRG